MKILIVDDDANIRLFVTAALDGDDVELLEAQSGLEALAIAAIERPDLILMDMMMPDMDGKTTLAKLREKPACIDIPVVFLTAKVQSEEIESYIKLGAAGVITKPFDPMTLPEEVANILKAVKQAK